MDTLIVHGFIRQIEKLLENHKIIPFDIYHICFDFYFTTTIVFYLSGLKNYQKASDDPDKDLICAVNMENKERWKINIHELNDPKSMITVQDVEKGDYHKWSIDYGGIVFTRNLSLPPSIVNKIPDKNMKFNNIVFRCGGMNNHYGSTDYCGALIIDSREFQKASNAKITAYNWDLPRLPKEFVGLYPLYSTQTNELFALSEHASIPVLSFNNDKYHNQEPDWCWNELDTKIPNTHQGLSAVITRNQRLFIIGGNAKKVDIYNIGDNKWIACKERIYEGEVCGIYYNEPNDIIYVGGGYDTDYEDMGTALKNTEYYNLEKDVWISLPDTNKEHDVYPLIWLEDDHNLLHIMSISSNCIEFIDLREGKEWTIKDENASEMFDTKFMDGVFNATVSRFVGN